MIRNETHLTEKVGGFFRPQIAFLGDVMLHATHVISDALPEGGLFESFDDHLTHPFDGPEFE